MSDPVLEVPFLGGIDEAARDEIVDPATSFITLENVRQNKRGGAEKRLGYAALPTARIDATSRTAGSRVFPHQNAVCTIDGTNLDAFTSVSDVARVAGRVPEADVRLYDCPAPGVSNTFEDVAYVNGYLCAAYRAFNGVAFYDMVATLLDATTFAVVSAPQTVFADGSDVCLATYGTYVLLFAAKSSASTVHVSYLNTATAATITTGWIPIGTIATDYGGHLSVESLTTKAVVGYRSTTALTVAIKSVDITGTLQSANIATVGAPFHMDVAGTTGDTLWVAWSETTIVRVQGRSTTDITSVTSTTGTILTMSGIAEISIVPTTTGRGRVMANLGTNPVWPAMRVCTFRANAGATTQVGAEVAVPSFNFCSRGFYQNGRVYVHATMDRPSSGPPDEAQQQQIVLVDVSDETTHVRPVACPTFNVAVPSARWSVVNTGGGKPNIPAGANPTKRYAPIGLRRGGAANAAAIVEYDFASTDRWQPVAHQRSTVLSGGILSVFDGVRVLEVGFLFRPRRPTVTQTGTGPTTTLGGWNYVAVFEDMDSAGNWTQSGVSAPISTGNFTNKSILVATQPISVTTRHSTAFNSSTRVTFYRTTDGGEPPYYKVASVLNDTSVTSVSFTDGITDASLVNGALLYGTGNLPATNGSGQDRRAPPGLRHVVSYNGMLVGALGSVIYYSGQPIDGEGTWFSPVFSQPVDAEVTGLAVQDGSCLVFTRDGVWSTAGSPPSDNGQQGGLSTPRKLAVDLGCTNARSVVTTSRGTFFQSSRGIELLSRSETSEFIGASIQDTLASYPIVTSAVLDSKEGLVRFSLATSETDGVASATGVDLVFDLAIGVWLSRDVKRGASASQASQDACVAYVEGAWRYCWIATDGTIHYERLASDAAAHLDGGDTWITQKAVTSWVHIAGLQGEQLIDQVLLLAKQSTAHDVTISLAFDYAESFTSTKTFSAATLATLGRQWLVKEAGQTTSNAIRAQLVDSTPSSGTVGTGKGGTWICLTFGGHPHRGVKRSSSAQRGTV